MPTTFAPEPAATFCSSGISFTHGPHQVAQKLSTTTLPASERLATVEPSSALSEKPGARRPSSTPPPSSPAPRQLINSSAHKPTQILSSSDLISLFLNGTYRTYRTYESHS